MSLTTHSIYSFKKRFSTLGFSLAKIIAGGGLCLNIIGCATFEDEKPHLKGPALKVMVGSYDEVWRAIQKSFSGYPIQVNNLDQGILETDVIKGAQVWAPPYEKSPRPANYHYVLNVRVVKGRSKGKESAQVMVVKHISLQRDFFSLDEEIPSDGLEEESLLYRIDRELQIERSLRKAFERK